jgi:hypothetical protein
MLKRTVLSLPLLALMMAPWPGFAQNQDASGTEGRLMVPRRLQAAPESQESQKFYKLEFVVKEVEGGKVLNTRAYSTTVSFDAKDTGSTSIRARGRVAYQTTTGDTKSVQYLDIGVSIDCRSIKEVGRGLSLYVSADISSVPSDTSAATAPPTIRQNTWNSVTIVPPKKPTLIFSSDDPMSKRQMQLELTATPII